MRLLPADILEEKNKQQSTMIDLLIVEVSKAYISLAQNGAGSLAFRLYLSDTLSTQLDTDGVDITESGDGWFWVATIEKGNNAGSFRKILYRDGNEIRVEPLPNDSYSSSNTDKIRISKCVFLACWNKPVRFWLPDVCSATYNYDVEFVPFPCSIEPIGTSITGEVLNINASLSNVDRVIGNAVQSAGGLRGNRVTHLRVFDGYTADDNNPNGADKDYCIKDVMYIDSVSISEESVDFTLESRFNIVGVKIPLRTYNRSFCSFKFGSVECGYGHTGIGSTSLDSDYPLASESNCDHTLYGPNGCTAHNNGDRFGGFPAIPSGD